MLYAMLSIQLTCARICRKCIAFPWMWQYKQTTDCIGEGNVCGDRKHYLR